MGGDMIVALGRATVDGHTLFGHNCRQPGRVALCLHRSPGKAHAPDERVSLHRAVLPQARETLTTVGLQALGQWGYLHGFNVCGVAIGCTALRTRLACDAPGLLGIELVRLALERAHTARQAVDLIGDLVSRHGQGSTDENPIDSAFLIADGREAFTLETAGRFWAQQEVRQARAMSDFCTIRQDWDRVAHGLAACAMEHGWRPDDGSKLDFAGIAAPELVQTGSPLRRWGRATLLLEEQNGHLDLAFFRRLLGDHYEGCDDEADPVHPGRGLPPLCQHPRTPDAPMTGSSLTARINESAGTCHVAWCCPGPPCIGVYLPILLDGELPEAFASGSAHLRIRQLMNHVGVNRGLWDLARDSLGRLQARIDQETDEFILEASAAGQRETGKERNRQAVFFMQHILERFEETVAGLMRQRPLRTGGIAGPLQEIPERTAVQSGR
jgi:secernin